MNCPEMKSAEVIDSQPRVVDFADTQSRGGDTPVWDNDADTGEYDLAFTAQPCHGTVSGVDVPPASMTSGAL